MLDYHLFLSYNLIIVKIKGKEVQKMIEYLLAKEKIQELRAQAQRQRSRKG